nr:alkane hydroxylase MAH1-like [Ziziphus jujuba var. spinosa]
MALLAIFLLLLVVVVVIGHRRKKRNSGLLTNWPVVGMMPELLENITRIHDFATDVLKNSGGTFEFKGPWFANHYFLVTNDPINAHHILNASFANYPKGPDFKKIFEPFGDGIINSDEKHVTYGVDLQDVFQRLTFDNICLLVLGFDPHCLSIEFPKVECKKAFDDVEEIIFHRHFKPQSWWRLQRWLQLGREKKLTRSLKVVKETWGEDCLEFKPERWISCDGKEIVNVPAYKFTAYNAGPQSCLSKGMSFIV